MAFNPNPCRSIGLDPEIGPTRDIWIDAACAEHLVNYSLTQLAFGQSNLAFVNEFIPCVGHHFFIPSSKVLMPTRPPISINKTQIVPINATPYCCGIPKLFPITAAQAGTHAIPHEPIISVPSTKKITRPTFFAIPITATLHLPSRDGRSRGSAATVP